VDLTVNKVKTIHMIQPFDWSVDDPAWFYSTACHHTIKGTHVTQVQSRVTCQNCLEYLEKLERVEKKIGVGGG